LSTELPKVAVIGAGSSGITALKGLVDRGIDAVAYEASDRIGGNWVFGNSNGMSASYRSLHINTSRERMEYSDYPMPKSYPDFPHHSHIAEYFDDYVDQFGLRERIRFETAVEQAERGEDGVWTLRDSRGGADRFDALLVANGHHWDPRWPEPAFPGTFDGLEMHAHSFTDGEMFRGKKVVVLGMGNSAMDIAVESSYIADETYLAARRGAHIIPKYIFGKPLDQILGSDPRVPWKVRQAIFGGILRSQIGKVESYGLPKPDHKLGDAHPTISDTILSRITHGAIKVKPNIAELKGDRIRFVDGSEVEADVVIYCTGYKVTFPFFDEDFIAAPENDLPLFRRVFKPGFDNLFFVGLLQPLGAVMPLAEAQGRWVASYLRGEYALPAGPAMEADIGVERDAMFKRYVKSKRHTMQVDFEDYMRTLDVEIEAGAERARERGFALPVPARAGSAAAAA
jgi:cation diffusion facilitator CzcD-associated flavoprotein CzcO